jgi:hypothetical protein
MQTRAAFLVGRYLGRRVVRVVVTLDTKAGRAVLVILGGVVEERAGAQRNSNLFAILPSFDPILVW